VQLLFPLLVDEFGSLNLFYATLVSAEVGLAFLVCIFQEEKVIFQETKGPIIMNTLVIVGYSNGHYTCITQIG